MEKIEDLGEINVPNIIEVLHRKTRRIHRLEKKIIAMKNILTKDDWEILDSALSTASLYAQGMDLIDINELQTGKLYRLRELLESSEFKENDPTCSDTLTPEEQK